MFETGGRGVDVVLNSLSGDLLHASWKCVAEFGKLIELGKRDLMAFGKLDLQHFLPNRSYSCVDLAHMIRERPKAVGRYVSSQTKRCKSRILMEAQDHGTVDTDVRGRLSLPYPSSGSLLTN